MAVTHQASGHIRGGFRHGHFPAQQKFKRNWRILPAVRVILKRQISGSRDLKPTSLLLFSDTTNRSEGKRVWKTLRVNLKPLFNTRWHRLIMGSARYSSPSFLPLPLRTFPTGSRSEERRVGKERRVR